MGQDKDSLVTEGKGKKKKKRMQRQSLMIPLKETDAQPLSKELLTWKSATANLKVKPHSIFLYPRFFMHDVIGYGICL